MEHVLELKNISHSYHNTEGETPALKDLSFFLKKGEFISIVGPSGCGKSTLLSLIAGLLVPESGTILINGKQLKESTTNIDTCYKEIICLNGERFITMSF